LARTAEKVAFRAIVVLAIEPPSQNSKVAFLNADQLMENDAYSCV